MVFIIRRLGIPLFALNEKVAGPEHLGLTVVLRNALILNNKLLVGINTHFLCWRNTANLLYNKVTEGHFF